MKKVFCIILTIFISILISLFCISYGIKDACVNTISNAIVKREITSKIVLSVKNIYSDVSYETLEDIEDEVSNNVSINELTSKYFEEIVDSIINNREIESPDTKKELLSLLEDNENVLEKHGIEVSEDQKQKIIDEIVESNIVNDVYKKVSTIIKKNLNENQKKAVNMYKIVISKNFRLILISLIIISLILLILFKKSAYKFSINLGIAGVLSGIFITFILPIITNMISNELTSKLIGESALININKLINYGYLCFIFASIFIIIYFIGNKIVSYNNEKYAE